MGHGLREEIEKSGKKEQRWEDGLAATVRGEVTEPATRAAPDKVQGRIQAPVFMIGLAATASYAPEDSLGFFGRFDPHIH